MTPEARILLGQKMTQLERYSDDHEIGINARDLRAFGMDVPESINPGAAVLLTVGQLRALAVEEAVVPVEDDCGCDDKE